MCRMMGAAQMQCQHVFHVAPFSYARRCLQQRTIHSEVRSPTCSRTRKLMSSLDGGDEDAGDISELSARLKISTDKLRRLVADVNDETGVGTLDSELEGGLDERLHEWRKTVRDLAKQAERAKHRIVDASALRPAGVFGKNPVEAALGRSRQTGDSAAHVCAELVSF